MRAGPSVVVTSLSLLLLAIAAGACSSPGPDPVPGDDDGGVEPGPDAGVPPPTDAGIDAEPPFAFVRCGETRAPLPALVEDRRVYQQDEPQTEVWTVDVRIDDLETFARVNAGDREAEVPVIFTDGTFGAGVTTPNATLRLRGGMSVQNRQKNYKIEIGDNLGRWHNQKEINLNKHMTDLTRMRNKLAFELFQGIPGLTSLRTHYVQMRVNGADFGLYTWIEEPDRRFLESHGLDPAGQLYKSFGYRFQRISAATAADPAAFAMIVEKKANPDDAKFLRMNDAVNDRSRDIDEIVDQYFNRENLDTWIATNVLLNNVDTRTQNFYLYSPSSCDGFYLVPWDYDGAWDFYAQLDGVDSIRERWERGLSNWWEVNLWERYLTKPANVAAVDARIRELAAGTLTEAAIAAKIARYHDVVLPYISRDPDLRNLPGHFSGHPPEHGVQIWNAELARITPTPTRFLAEYDSVKERPMPVFLATQPRPDGVQFRWDPSFDLQHDPIAYDLQVSTTAAFAAPDLVVDVGTGTEDEYTVSGLGPGVYFWRVIIRDTAHADAWQLPFDPYELVTVP